MIKEIHDFRNSQTALTDQELAYCEHDCRVEYYRYIEKIINIKTVFIFTLLRIFIKQEEKNDKGNA